MGFAGVCIVFCQIFALSGSPDFWDRVKREPRDKIFRADHGGCSTYRLGHLQPERCNEDFAWRTGFSIAETLESSCWQGVER